MKELKKILIGLCISIIILQNKALGAQPAYGIQNPYYKTTIMSKILKISIIPIILIIGFIIYLIKKKNNKKKKEK